MSDGFDINAWVNRILNGTGGMRAFYRYECLGQRPKHRDVAAWVLRCLANPKCEGAAEVLAAIEARRQEVKP